MQYIHYIEESKTWKCPKTGKYKVICVGGGGTGVLYTTSTETASQYIYQNGNPTSFGSYLTAEGSQISNPQSSLNTDMYNSSNDNFTSFTHVGGYGGYDGTKFGGNPESVFYTGRYQYFTQGNVSNTSNSGRMFHNPPDGNGGSINDASMSGNYGAGGFSRVSVKNASKLSTLKFAYKAYYNSFSYTYDVSVPDSNSSRSHSETRTGTMPGGYVTLYYYGPGDFITQKELLPSNNLPLPSTVSVRTPNYDVSGTSKNRPITKYVFDTQPVVSSTSAVVPLYPIKVRNNGSMKVDIIELTKDEEIPCTVGNSGRSLDAGISAVTDKSYLKSGLSSDSNTGDFSNNIGDGTNGVIIIQFLGE